MKEIIAIRKDNLDRIIQFKMSDGKIYNYEMAKEEIIDDKVSNAQVILGKDNLWIILGKNTANSDFSNLVELDKNGYILVDNDLQSKTEGLFVAGDCRQKKVRQLTTAVSDGAMASVGAVSYIDKNFE